MTRTYSTSVLALATAIASVSALARAAPPDKVADRWDFALKDFIVGAWLGPDGTDAEVRVYAEAGFNVVMLGRYMSHGSYASVDSIQSELDLAQRHRLWAMVDTYTQNDKPWGGVAPAGPMPGHHNASLAELEWLHARVGQHPALAGYMLGDDQGQMAGTLAETTAYLRETAPHLIPWVCGWVRADDLASNGNPFANWQIYPTLYSTNEPAEVQCRMYCDTFDSLRASCEATGVTPWPMINADGADVSDSTLRFPVYAALAYGAQGMWYFTYRNCCCAYPEASPGSEDYATALASTTRLYPVTKTTNWRLREWGPDLLGRVSSRRFATGWPIESAPRPTADALVTAMDDDLLVGILTRDDDLPIAIVVSKRVGKQFGGCPPRDVTVTFSTAVGRTRVEDLTGAREGNVVTLSLAGGEGAMVRLYPAPGRRQELVRLAAY